MSIQVVETTVVKEGNYYVHRGGNKRRSDRGMVLVCALAVDDRTGADQVIYQIIDGPQAGSLRGSSVQRFALFYKSRGYSPSNN